MAYRNKTYVCFDGDRDIHYYRLMKAWKRHPSIAFDFHDAHDLNTARDGSLQETIKRRLRERFANSKALVVLVGESTRYLYRFVRWEMEIALDLGLPIIVCNLNGMRQLDEERCPPIVRDALAVHISFNAAILAHALEQWPSEHRERMRRYETGSFYYSAAVYRDLGL